MTAVREVDFYVGFVDDEKKKAIAGVDKSGKSLISAT